MQDLREQSPLTTCFSQASRIRAAQDLCAEQAEQVVSKSPSRAAPCDTADEQPRISSGNPNNGRRVMSQVASLQDLLQKLESKNAVFKTLLRQPNLRTTRISEYNALMTKEVRPKRR